MTEEDRARADKAERDLARMTEERDRAIRERDAAVLAEREACAAEMNARATADFHAERAEVFKEARNAIRARSTPAPVQP